MAERRLPDRVYHLAEAANWASIQLSGLLSAGELLASTGIDARERARLNRTQRLVHTTLTSGVQIRDQCPMPPGALRRCLCGMSPEDWYATVNSYVFFWIDPARLSRQRAACGSRSQVVMVVETASLLEAHAGRVHVTPINTGNARRRPARRGAATFVPLVEWNRSGWVSEAAALGIPLRKRTHRPVELTVRDHVRDVMRFVVDVVELSRGKAFVPRSSASRKR